MAAALTLLLIGSLLQGALCGEFKASMPKTIEVVSGSCVTIPCSFDVEDQYETTLDNTCRAMWINDWRTVVFDSSNRQSTNNGELRGNLTRKNCTTTLNNMQPANSYNYFFRVECDKGLKYTFTERISISVTDDPPRPTLTPSALKVMEGTSVSLKCSAPTPCLSHPPTLTWTKGLGDSEETLQENQDKTKVKTSVVTFTASKKHHGKTISCTATYNKQDGSTESAVSTSLTADISCALCGKFKASMPKTIEVVRGSCVTIPCSFEIDDQYETHLDNTCRAVWKTEQKTVVFDSNDPQTSTNNGELRGDLTKKICTTTLNNMQPANINNYFFRVDCKGLKYDFNFHEISISVTDDPPRPTLTPSALKVKEGTSVSLTCSAPAPCLSHPPTLTWTKGLGDSEETLQENQDKTKVKTSVVNFTASPNHHGKTISCTVTYNKQDGSTESAVSTSLTADISFAPQILFSSDCIKAADQLNCSCRTVGNPSPTLLWYLDGSPVNHPDTFVVSNEPLNDTGLWSTITVNGPQERDLSTLLCRSSNSLGSATQRFCVNSLEPRTSEESQGSDQHCGPYRGVLLLAVAVVSLSVNVLFTVCVAFLWKSRKRVKPKEVDQTYMSLDPRDRSPEYDVIAQTSK